MLDDSPRALAIGKAVARAALGLDEQRRKLYVDAMLQALNEAARSLLEAWMDKHEYRSEFARKYVAEGRAEGHIEAYVALALEFAETRLGALPAGLGERLREGADIDRLQALARALGLARDAAEAQAALDRHFGNGTRDR